MLHEVAGHHGTDADDGELPKADVATPTGEDHEAHGGEGPHDRDGRQVEVRGRPRQRDEDERQDDDPEDGRAVVLQLSPRGVTRLEQVRSSRRELMERLTDDWSETERATFCSLLTRFNSALSMASTPTSTPAR